MADIDRRETYSPIAPEASYPEGSKEARLVEIQKKINALCEEREKILQEKAEPK